MLPCFRPTSRPGAPARLLCRLAPLLLLAACAPVVSHAPRVEPGPSLGVVLAARALGLGEGRALLERARRWAPYRAYAVQHLWAVGDHAVNHLPVDRPHIDHSEERP